MLPIEDVAAALFALAQPLLAGSTPPPAGQFARMSRILLPAAQLQPPDSPALFQVQVGGSPVVKTMEGLYAFRMTFDWVIYAYSQDESIPPSQVLNPMVNAALSVLPPETNLPFTVDGIPCPFSFDGELQFVEGIISNISVAVIPIVVLVPWATNT